MQNRELVIISVQPQNVDFIWQVRVQLNNFRKYNISSKYHILFYVEKGHSLHQDIMDLATDFPEAHFYFYVDDKNECLPLIQNFNYISLLRPWCLSKHFEKNPDLTDKAVLYIDSDVIFLKNPDFLTQEILDDDINYLSDTRGYIAASYFDSKEKDVAEHKLADYKKIDVLNEAASMCGISREICVENEYNTGGAQYLLKNINAKFWKDVIDCCLMLTVYLRNINQRYFKGSPGIERENSGFQSWCADMWGVLWTLWKRGQITRTPSFMDFGWSGESIEEVKDKYFYHDAQACAQCFNKVDYRIKKKSPIGDDLSWVDHTKASWLYSQAIMNSVK